MRRTVGRLLSWLPCAIAAFGVLLIVSTIFTTSGESLDNPTWPFPTATTAAVIPGIGWTSKSPSGSQPIIFPAGLTVEVLSLDVGSQTISARLNLRFTDAVASDLRISDASRSAAVPLTAVQQKVWADLPVTIELGACLTHLTVQENCYRPIATVPLGDLISQDGHTASVYGFSTPETITIAVSGWPNRFPSDSYQLTMTPFVTLPMGVNLSGGSNVPTYLIITADPSLADHTLTAAEDSPNQPLVVGLVISRSPRYQLTIYIVALLPLLLGLVVVHIWLRRKQPIFDLGFIAGLIAVMLAILPLRAVLIPADLSTIGLTLVDDILVLGVLLISVMLFAQYARVVTIHPIRSLHPKSDAQSDHTEPEKLGK